MNLFVAGLPLDMDDAELKEMFEEFGEVRSAKVILDRKTSKSRGFGFVEMSDTTAGEAMKELNISEIGGSRLSVKIAEDKRNIQRGNRNFRTEYKTEVHKNSNRN